MNILFSCIGRRGYIAEYFRDYLEPNDRIIGTANSEWTSGFRACDLQAIMPDILNSDYIPTLITLCQEQKIDAILSFNDQDIDVLSQHLDEFRSFGVVPIIPSPLVNEICFDKYRTYLFLKEHGFDTPETYIDLENALSAIDTGKLAFPLIVKPRCGSASHNVFTAHNINELKIFFNYAPNMLIQEMITGQEYGFDICNDLQGQVLAVVPKRKIAMRSGETDQAETCDTPSLIDLGLRLGQKLGHIGPLDVDLFVQGSKTFILELNPRFGGGYPVSHLAGAQFPQLILKMIKGETVQPQIGQFQSGVIMMKEYNVMGGKKVDFFRSIFKMS
ncbi:MAG: ATP-grasp domain-containing protein [Gloeocapsa sp. UFS-A4-WI-NPMV-4B04]|jgi:carbamoyl-phosphate synthase large subunit|nr:ATP-grasp domain-containing protein [Gloeocapsa sp. UFS-A4-WI-NPMV-4B04]